MFDQLSEHWDYLEDGLGNFLLFKRLWQITQKLTFLTFDGRVGKG
ncbi:hypothetical protein [Shewanella sp. BC20]|nr:hypothetical protein [Shewanella sp. BC20]